MTQFIEIKPGQWVLAFSQPYGPYDKTIEKHLEMFTHRGGGWESHRPDDIFMVHRVSSVAPKTYMAPETERWRHGRPGQDKRFDRINVIAAGKTEAEMIAIRDNLFAIGVTADDRIEAEMYRRIEKFAARERAKAEKKIHKLFPHFFEGNPT